MMERILLGGVAVLFLAGYAAWKWHRAGQWVDAQEAGKAAARAYRDAMLRDPRWLALKAQVEGRYPLSIEFGGDPNAFAVYHVAVVDDRGQMCRIDNAVAPTRVVAMLVRQAPATQLYVSMDLRTGEVREDPAPHGWTYFGPYL